MELTKEYFDQALKAAVAPLATKDDVHREVRDGVEELARMVSRGFDDVLNRLDVRDQVERHEKALQEISRKMGLHFEL